MSDLDTIEVLVIKRLRDLARSKGKDQFIPASEIFSSMPSFFGISEEDEWAVLRCLEEKGLIDVVPAKGIKLKT
jgi:hypothetical protein